MYMHMCICIGDLNIVREGRDRGRGIEIGS